MWRTERQSESRNGRWTLISIGIDWHVEDAVTSLNTTLFLWRWVIRWCWRAHHRRTQIHYRSQLKTIDIYVLYMIRDGKKQTTELLALFKHDNRNNCSLIIPEINTIQWVVVWRWVNLGVVLSSLGKTCVELSTSAKLIDAHDLYKVFEEKKPALVLAVHQLGINIVIVMIWADRSIPLNMAGGGGVKDRDRRG